ncbi:reverse transcriptase family protein [Pseudomonas sp. UMAB-40]|uniref:reverse transcriptase family protein n=1 Tax=Pseudomonas sp. UMAB-40 TaxID=1365407 RepID=UPI001C58FACD|nr:reverse transcriptase family protein [Pseudomonas sp. UMAB-40]
MAKKSLSLLFDAMYHGKHDFLDFIEGDVADKYKVAIVKGMEVCKPDDKLKVYHKFLILFVFEFLRVNQDVVFSYRKGVNVASAVQKHAGSRHFFQTDLRSFFRSISRSLVKQTLLNNLDSIPVADLQENLERILDLVTVNGGVPIGFSTSPIISNACLYDFDNQLELYCKAHDLVYTRYSDDIIISGVENKLYGVDGVVGEVLGKCFGEMLSVNVSKTKFSSVGNKIKILGMVILPNGVITIDSKLKNTIEVLLHFYSSDKVKFNDRLETESAKLKGDNSLGLLQISGYLNYVNTTDPAYLNKLRKKYGAAVVDSFIRGSVK